MVYAVIDPRDGHELEYFFTRERAMDYARWLEASTCHGYRMQDIRLQVKAVKP